MWQPATCFGIRIFDVAYISEIKEVVFDVVGFCGNDKKPPETVDVGRYSLSGGDYRTTDKLCKNGSALIFQGGI